MSTIIPIPKFARTRGTLLCELRNQRDTSNSMILVPLLNPKFATAALASEASGQRGDSIACAHSASEDARERAGDTRPEPGSSARALAVRCVRTSGSGH